MTHWFPLFGRDFLAATLGWTAEERGHYITLIITQWEQGGLPDDLKRMELISPGVSKVWETLSPKFPKSVGGLRKNARLEHERHLSHQRSERARQSASARWSKASDDAAACADGDADAMPEQCDRICDRICSDDASMSMSYSPPPPPSPPGDFSDDWERLRTAWNAEWKDAKRQWRSVEAPPEALARLQEPDWLSDALRAIPEIRKACTGFQTPPTLRQFCRRDERGTFVSRMLGGEFVDSSAGRRRRESAAT